MKSVELQQVASDGYRRRRRRRRRRQYDENAATDCNENINEIKPRALLLIYTAARPMENKMSSAPRGIVGRYTHGTCADARGIVNERRNFPFVKR